MQNDKALIDLGFKKIGSEYLFRGSHYKFIAIVVTCNGPMPYVTLYKVCTTIDNRPKSNRRGYHFRRVIKDCVSNGSVERAIKKYDVKS